MVIVTTSKEDVCVILVLVVINVKFQLVLIIAMDMASVCRIVNVYVTPITSEQTVQLLFVKTTVITKATA